MPRKFRFHPTTLSRLKNLQNAFIKRRHGYERSAVVAVRILFLYTTSVAISCLIGVRCLSGFVKRDAVRRTRKITAREKRRHETGKIVISSSGKRLRLSQAQPASA